VFAAPVPRLLGAARELLERDGTPPLTNVRVLAATRVGDERAPLAGRETDTRIVTLDWIGTHPDALDATLRAAWELEEVARSTGAPVVALRMAPLVGPDSPLMAWLAGHPRLDARSRRVLLQPVLERDAVATLARAIAGLGPTSGAFEVCGREVMNLDELMERAIVCGPEAFFAEPECEPSLSILRVQGMCEWAPWSLAFGITPSPIDEALTPEASR
jgi:hypothetical protein